MKELPANWNEMSLLEQDKFFTRFYKNFLREGESVGLLKDAPEEIVKAYEEFLKNSESK